MILPYCIAIMFFIQAARNYHYTRQYGGFCQDVTTWPLLLKLSNIVSTVGGLGLLIGGIFLGEWWWPLAAIGFTIVVGGCIQRRHDGAIVSLTSLARGACISALIGLICAGILLLA